MGAFSAFASPFQQLRPIQAPSPMEYAAQFAQLRALADQRQLREQQIALGQQEQQANTLKIQQAQQAQRDQQLLTKAYLDSGGDLEKFRVNAANSGASIGGINTAAEAMLKHQKEVSAYNKDELANYDARNSAIRNASETLLGIQDPDQRAAAFQQMKPGLVKAGITDLPDQLPTGPQGDQWLQLHRNWALSAEQISNRAKAAQEAKSADVKFGETTRAAAAKELAGVMDLNTGQVTDRAGYNALAAKPEYKGIFPPVPDAGFNQRFYATNAIPGEKLPEWQTQQRLAAKSREQWMDEAAQAVPAQVTIDGKTYDTSGLQQRTVGDVKRALDRGDFKTADQIIRDAGKTINATEQAVRTETAKAPIKIQVAGAEAAARVPNVGDSGLDLMAEDLLNGKPPSSRNPVLYAKVYQRASELAKSRGLDAQGVILARNAAQANKTALNALTKQYEVLKPFGEMAEKNADLLEKRMAEVSDLGAPLLNTPLRSLEAKFGSTKVAALNAALQPVQADFARVLSSPTGGGQLSDSARHEMQQAILPGATVGQLKAALDVFRQDWKNRKESYNAAIQDLTGRSVAGGGGTQQAGGASALPTHLTQADIGKTYQNRAGKRVKITAVNPNDPTQYRAEEQP